jgi:hypothetical protein
MATDFGWRITGDWPVANPVRPDSLARVLSEFDRWHPIAVRQLAGVQFDAEPPHPTCIDVTAIGQTPRSEWTCGPECPKEA